MASWQFLLSPLLLVTLYCKGYSAILCGKFTYHHRPELDGKTFTQGSLQVKTDISQRECFSDCFHDKSCNMVLLNPTTRECHLFSTAFSDLTYAVSSPGFQYYGAECSVSKSFASPTTICQSQFAPFDDPVSTPAQCYDDGTWVDRPLVTHTCKRVEWTNTVLDHFDLPSPVVSGLVIEIRGAASVSNGLFCALRDPVLSPEVTLLQIWGGGSSAVRVHDGTNWLSSISKNPFPVTLGAVFDLRVVFTDTQYQVTVNGNPFVVSTMYNPMDVFTYIQMFNWNPLELLKLTYP